MNPTTTEIEEEAEMNSRTSINTIQSDGSPSSDCGPIENFNRTSGTPFLGKPSSFNQVVDDGRIFGERVHGPPRGEDVRGIPTSPTRFMRNSSLTDFPQVDDIGGIGTSTRFLGNPPSFDDVGRHQRNDSFAERPRLSIGDLLDIPSAPASPKRPQRADQSHPLSPQGLQRKSDTNAAGSPSNRPSGELVDKVSTGINNIPNAPSALPQPQHLSNVTMNAIKQEHTIKIPSTSEEQLADEATNTIDQGHTDYIRSTTLPGNWKAPPNLPCGDLLESREDYYRFCVPLYEASITGDWEAANAILDKYPKLVRFAITENYELALHVAILAEVTKRTERFVENLVNLMTGEDLELQDSSYNTAFCVAAKAGNINMIQIMLEKNPNLLNIPGSNKMMPLYMSALLGKHETVKYLYHLSDNMANEFWTPKYQDWMLETCVEGDFFDVAIQIVESRPKLAMNIESVLGILARKPDAIFDGVEQKLVTRIINSIFRFKNRKVGPAEKDSDALKLLTIIWKDAITKMPRSQVDHILRGPRGILFVAAEMGNTSFVIKLLQAHPYLIVSVNKELHTIFHLAVMNRHCDIHNLLYEIGAQKDLIIPLKDRDGNNILHLVGKTS